MSGTLLITHHSCPDHWFTQSAIVRRCGVSIINKKKILNKLVSATHITGNTPILKFNRRLSIIYANYHKVLLRQDDWHSFSMKYNIHMWLIGGRFVLILYIHTKLILYIYKRVSSRSKKHPLISLLLMFYHWITLSSMIILMLLIRRNFRLKKLQMLQNGLIILTFIWSWRGW